MSDAIFRLFRAALGLLSPRTGGRRKQIEQTFIELNTHHSTFLNLLDKTVSDVELW